ncbi:MAG TPA: glycoside hydrolase family 3 N-terminal domain-containing protein [Mucilaginibacter sp.]|nr:glycoside hydrolase family 3 N-terminal domain-containing protein [Mucilaginibacter sp.]
MKPKRIISGILILLFSTSAFAQDYKNPKTSVPQRVKILLSKMTLEEKVAQLKSTFSAIPHIDPKFLSNAHKMDSLFGKGIGMINPDFTNTPEEAIANRNAIQQYLRTKTKLGIPTIFIDEAHHGLLGMKVDVFPSSIGLACSWDTLLTEKIYTYVAAQASSRGTNLALAPVIDPARDPRWGRTGETFGEDPYLCGLMGSAVVRGFQGTSDGSIALNHIASTLKHFTGHGQSESGVNQADADISQNTLRSIHMEPFRLAINHVKPAAIMPAYVDIDGVPAHANKWLLNDVLRKEWNYQGVIVSDWWAIDQLYQKHKTAADLKTAALQAFNAGVTVDEPMGGNYQDLVGLVKEGKIKMTDLDNQVAYVLALKFKLGLFDHSKEISLAEANARIAQPEGRKLSLKAAEESMVLLKNQNNILPLKADQYKKIAVIGPCAAVNYLGDYSGTTLHNVSLVEGIKNKLKAKGSTTEVVYAKGVDMSMHDDTISLGTSTNSGKAKLPNPEKNKGMIDSAVKVAADADIIICAVGQNQQFSQEAGLPENFGDMSTLDLVSNQNDLVKALIRTGKPVIVYLTHGRPLSINYIHQHADAILDGWYTGQESGNAAANILFGDVNPSGKLTITVPRSVGQLPINYDQKPSAHFFEYVTESNLPLYTFGYGMSYTNYQYGKPSLNGNTLAIEITNAGKTDGDEIVQLYVHPKVASVTQPLKALKGFSRIILKSGETKSVSFTITKNLLAYYNQHMKRVAEPGVYELMVGPNSVQVQTLNYIVQ